MEIVNSGKHHKQTIHTNNNNHTSSTAYNYVVNMQAKASFIKEVDNYNIELRKMYLKNNPLILHKIIELLLKLNNQYKNKLANVKDLTELNKIILEYKANVRKVLEIFTIEYCHKYNINIDISTLEKYSLKKLYEELEILRKKTINSLLDTIEEEYTLYSGYNILKENIKQIKIKTILNFTNGIYNKEETQKRFRTLVLLEFREYYRRLQVISEIKQHRYHDRYITETIQLMASQITADKTTFETLETAITQYIKQKQKNNKTKQKTISSSKKQN